MKARKLTGIAGGVTNCLRRGSTVHTGFALRAGLVALAAATVNGCININAPEDRIVIDLNINIQQEVIYRLAEDAAETIDQNADIF